MAQASADTTKRSRRKKRTKDKPQQKLEQVVAQPPARYQQRLGRLLREAVLFLAAAITAFLFASLLTYSTTDPGWSNTGQSSDIVNIFGAPGAWFADVLLSLFGIFGYICPWIILYYGWLVFTRIKRGPIDTWPKVVRCVSLILWLISGCGFAALMLGQTDYFPYGGGGVLGASVGQGLSQNMGEFGALWVFFTLFVITFSTGLGFSWLELAEKTGQTVLWILSGNFLQKVRERQNERLRQRQEIQQQKAALKAQKLAAKQEKLDYKAAKQSEKQAKKAPQFTQDSAVERLDKKPSGLKKLFSRNKNRLEPTLSDTPQADIAAASKGPELGQGLVIEPKTKQPKLGQASNKNIQNSAAKKASKRPAMVAFDPKTSSPLPPTTLLHQPPASKRQDDRDYLAHLSDLLEQNLADFNVKAKVVAVEPGPVITRFELDPAPGVKVSQISNLAKDLARALSTTSVRVVEVIPGKSVVGLEVPNYQRDVVALREIVEAPLYQKAKSPLTMALGKDISGEPVTADLAKMPHMLVAGTTGSGKSVAINAMILSILHQALPSQVRMILIDPKMLELSVYEGIPHLLAPVVTDMKEAANALRWCVGEMERRYKLMAALGVRNMAGFNAKVQAAIDAGEPIEDPLKKKALTEEEIAEGEIAETLEPMPAIVIIIDELADLMMVVGKKVEELIARLAQKARAAGLHMILATQRPSVDVITGLIKANIPTRIAFQVASRVDSRTILDQQGAEALLGKGDMLYLPPGTGFSTRVHGAFVDDDEVHQVVEYLKQVAEPEYIDEILEGASEEQAGGADMDDVESDPLYDQAVAVVTKSRRASISYVQRRLRVGYNRAARLIEQMELAGVVTTGEGGGKREVLAPEPPAD